MITSTNITVDELETFIVEAKLAIVIHDFLVDNGMHIGNTLHKDLLPQTAILVNRLYPKNRAENTNECYDTKTNETCKEGAEFCNAWSLEDFSAWVLALGGSVTTGDMYMHGYSEDGAYDLFQRAEAEGYGDLFTTVEGVYSTSTFFANEAKELDQGD